VKPFSKCNFHLFVIVVVVVVVAVVVVVVVNEEVEKFRDAQQGVIVGNDEPIPTVLQ
jgi:hypothetical protein